MGINEPMQVERGGKVGQLFRFLWGCPIRLVSIFLANDGSRSQSRHG